MIKILEKKLTGAILGIKLGTKTKSEAEGFLTQMHKINPMLAEDFRKKIDAAVLAVKK